MKETNWEGIYRHYNDQVAGPKPRYPINHQSLFIFHLNNSVIHHHEYIELYKMCWSTRTIESQQYAGALFTSK